MQIFFKTMHTHFYEINNLLYTFNIGINLTLRERNMKIKTTKEYRHSKIKLFHMRQNSQGKFNKSSVKQNIILKTHQLFWKTPTRYKFSI